MIGLLSHPVRAFSVLLVALLALTARANPNAQSLLSVVRQADTLTIKLAADTAPKVGRSLRIHSDRNAPVSRHGDVSPLQPKAWPDNRQPGPELWWPVIDFAVDDAMEAVVELADIPAGTQVSWNGWVRREKQPAGPTQRFPAARLLQWENTLWVDRAGPRLTRFHVRVPLPASGVTLRLLAPDWSGLIEVVASDGAGMESVLAARRIAAPPAAPTEARPAGVNFEPARLRAALAATVAHTLASVVTDPRDPMHGGLYVFYDLDARTYRTSHWIWGWGPSAGLLLDARRMPELVAEFGADRLLAAAQGLGAAALRTVPHDSASPARGIPASRWDRAPAMDFGHSYAITPCDAGFMAAWTWVRLGEATGDPKWTQACNELADALDRLMQEFPVSPQNYWPDPGQWDDRVIDEAGFGVELFAELHRVTGDARLRELGRRYIEQHLAALGRPDGLWDRVHFFDGRPNRPVVNMTRGLGWPMEGLLAAHRLLPEDGRYLELAQNMAAHLLAAQHPEGWWAHRFDQPAEVWGIGMKGTALWCWLFYKLHEQTGDPRQLAAARRALGWLLDHQDFGDDPRARGGLAAVSPHSAVGIRPWFRVTSTYGTAFFGLALLEELRVQQTGQPTKEHRPQILQPGSLTHDGRLERPADRPSARFNCRRGRHPELCLAAAPLPTTRDRAPSRRATDGARRRAKS